MTEATRCDMCGKIIRPDKVGFIDDIRLSVDGLMDRLDEQEAIFDLHRSCWNKIKKQFKELP